MSRKICVVTGTRAEYGLLRWVMQGIQEAPGLSLQVVATGMHLSPEFGLTFREIESDGFRIDRKVEMLTSSDTPVGISKSMGLGLIGFADALHELQPDLLVVLGDRFEILSAVAAALVARIPVAHLHGGETTEGAFDESIRHAISKMSHLHFVAAEEYRHRVIQLGELPDHVYTVGGLGVDAIRRQPFIEKSALESDLGFSFAQRNLLVTFHPVTLEDATAQAQLAELQAECRKVYVDPSLIQYAVKLVSATRDPARHGLKDLARFITFGASPRATISLVEGARALALLRGRGYALPEDMSDLAHDILRHRIVLSYEALSEGVDADTLVTRIMAKIPAPARPLEHESAPLAA